LAAGPRGDGRAMAQRWRWRSRGICPHAAAVAALALLIPGPAAVADTARQLDATLALEYDDNVTFGGRSRDQLDDTAGQIRLAYRQLHEIDPDRAWGFSAAIDTRQYVEYTDLGQVHIEVGPIWRQRLGRGFFAPLLELSLTSARIEARSDLRTGSRWAAAGIIQRRMTDSITARAGLHHSQRRAPDSDAFDQDRTGLFVQTDYQLRAHRTLYATLAWQTGDVAVTTDLGYGAYPSYGGWADGDADDAFGGEAEDRFAFGVEADLASLGIGYNHGFDRMSAIDTSIRATRGSMSGGPDYDRIELRIAYLLHFDLR
jgi:hypothetical protein